LIKVTNFSCAKKKKIHPQKLVNGIPPHLFRMKKVLTPQEVGTVNKVSRTGNKSTLDLYNVVVLTLVLLVQM